MKDEPETDQEAQKDIEKIMATMGVAEGILESIPWVSGEAPEHPLLDSTGQPITSVCNIVGTGEQGITLKFPREQFEQLSTKTREVLSQAALAQQRITKDQEEIDYLRKETRETLKRLRAA